MISFATVSPFVHAVQVGNGELIEAVMYVRTSPLNLYEDNGWVFTVAGATPLQISTTINSAKSLVGEAYGIGELLSDSERYFFHLPIIKRINPKYLTCSELVVWAWKQAGIMLTYEPEPSPASLGWTPVLLGDRPF